MGWKISKKVTFASFHFMYYVSHFIVIEKLICLHKHEFFYPKRGTIHMAGTAGIHRILVRDIGTFMFAGGVPVVITISGKLLGHY